MRAKRSLVPVGVGVVVFGTVTAFAATLDVSSTSLGAGNSTVESCSTTASVSYTTAYASALPGYHVATAPVVSATTCAGLSYKVTLSGTGGASLGERTGTLGADGKATPDFSSSTISVADVTGVSVVVSG